MFEAGDRIQIDKGLGRQVTAVILEVEYRNGTYIAKVSREDSNQIDVFAWNIYQEGISVRHIGAVLTPEQLKERLEAKYQEGYRAGWNDLQERENW